MCECCRPPDCLRVCAPCHEFLAEVSLSNVVGHFAEVAEPPDEEAAESGEPEEPLDVPAQVQVVQRQERTAAQPAAVRHATTLRLQTAQHHTRAEKEENNTPANTWIPRVSKKAREENPRSASVNIFCK